MKLRLAISQSNYAPWIGYFKLIDRVDKFIFLDDVQYTRRDWRNRNIIKNKNKKKWITIPVNSKGMFLSKINEIKINNHNWKNLHLSIIKENYKKSKYFELMYPIIEQIYLEINSNYLSKINQHLIKKISILLGIKTKFDVSEIYLKKTNCPRQRLLDICLQNESDTYVTGSSAQSYLITDYFKKKNIRIEWFDYEKEIGINEELKISILHILMNDINLLKEKFKFFSLRNL